MTAVRLHPPAPVRWAFVVPTAMLAATVAQVVLTLIGVALFDPYSASAPDWTIWAVKSMASLFMGASFVLAASWAAPSRRRVVSGIAAGIVVAWGLFLAFGGPGLWVWGSAMGGLGVTGALATCTFVWRSAA